MAAANYIEAHGQRMTISAWAKKLGVSRHVIHMRLKAGWSAKDSVGLHKWSGKGRPSMGQIDDIRRLASAGHGPSIVARMVGVSVDVASRTMNGRHWNHVATAEIPSRCKRVEAAIAVQQNTCRHERLLDDGRCWWCGLSAARERSSG